MATNLYIIRHGEAVVNVEGLAGGVKGCRGLTERGHDQARRLQARFATATIKADVLYASTLQRARETAEAAGAGLNLPIHWDDELQEVRPGDADGMTYDEVRERFETDETDRVYRPFAPGAESWAMFVARAGRSLNRLVHNHPHQSIVVVAHGGIIDASFYIFMGLPLRAGGYVGFGTKHTSITQWRLNEGEHGEQWLLMRYNDVAHLDEETLRSGGPA
jgi:probable phosphoglycerate mutase